ncbi:hypothetical protein AAMO2058_000971600 [Amorphochlora amoebiformis]
MERAPVSPSPSAPKSEFCRKEKGREDSLNRKRQRNRREEGGEGEGNGKRLKGKGKEEARPGQGPVKVFRFQKPSAEEFRSVISLKQPATLTNQIDDWKALTKWQDDGLINVISPKSLETVVTVQRSYPGGVFRGDYEGRSSSEMSLKQFLSQGINSSPNTPESLALYLAQCPMYCRNPTSLADRAKLPSLMRDISVPDIISSYQLNNVNLWVSRGQTVSSLHYDEHDNLLCVIQGIKTVTLIPPSETTKLSPRPVWSESANHSGVKELCPECAKIEVTIERGEVLYIPEGWWHTVLSRNRSPESPIIAVNLWFRTPLCPPHMETYYIRQLLVNRISAHKDHLIRETLALGSSLKNHGIRHIDRSNSSEILLKVSKEVSDARERIGFLVDVPSGELTGIIRHLISSRPKEWAKSFKSWDIMSTHVLMQKLESAELLTETGKEEKIGEFYTDFFGTLEDGEAEDWGGGVAPARVQERVSSYSKHCALDFMRRALGFQI